MQSSSYEYRQAMNAQLRPRSAVVVNIGVINQLAQEEAYVSSEYEIFPYIEQAFENAKFEAYYVTCEENFAREGMYFPPEDVSTMALYQGIVSKTVVNGLISISFDTEKSIKGLTIDFGEFYPEDFTIAAGGKTVNVTGNQSRKYVTEETFDDIATITITAIKMIGGNKRLRILSILFGIGIQFTNEDIEKTELREKISPICEELYSKSFRYDVQNFGMKFNIDNPESYANYLEQGQAVEFLYGRELPTGMYWIKGGNVRLKTWNFNDKIASFTTCGQIEFLDGIYRKGTYQAEGKSLYHLAEDVFTDAGVESYYIDPYLKNVLTKNPLPVATHKECLQIIANAGRCILKEDRDGVISIVSSFVPDVVSVVSDDQTEYSNAANIIKKIELINYADATSAYSDNNVYFLPSSSEYLDCGYVSSSISNENGLFDVNPVIKVGLESQTKVYGLTIAFAGNEPDEVIIRQYLAGDLVGSITWKEFESITNIKYEFESFDAIELEFVKTKPHNRIRVNSILFGDDTDYVMTKEDLFEDPVSSGLEKVKNVITVITQFSKNAEQKELLTVDCMAGDNIIELSAPCYGYSAAFYAGTDDEPIEIGNDWTVSITEMGTYYLVIHTNVEATVVINGYEYNQSQKNHSAMLHDIGVTKTMSNPLIDTYSLAKDVSEWISAYFNNDIFYDLSYRGEPALDCNDLIYLENDFVEDNKIRICEHNISTSAGMGKCSIGARRISHGSIVV